ncbi:MAG: hypothetical protein PHU36_02820 [Syntrophomonadaceae bacterium]|nr:hypothetical protein [Syntrophomonadaceae bacterium]
MAFELSINEIELLNAYECLAAHEQKELKEYLRYLLCKQYRREVMMAVFNNHLMNNLFNSLLHIIDGKELDINLVARRVYQMKEFYFGTFQKVHYKYCEVVENLDSNETVREIGRTAFENIERAINSGNETKIRMEILNFYQEYSLLSQKKDARKIIAV